jgi:hypothetical protein
MFKYRVYDELRIWIRGGRRWKDNIRVDLGMITGCEDRRRMSLLQDRCPISGS